MRIVLVTPAAASPRTGNRHTAARWAGFLRELGHRVKIQAAWDGAAADLMIALHARRSHDSIRRFVAAFPTRPLVVVLTGTDLYRDIGHDADARLSMDLATRLIILQERGFDELTPRLREKTRVIYQSARPVAARSKPKNCFQVCVVGHLRAEKDPFRCAHALRLIPADQPMKVIQLGAALEPSMAEEARSLMAADPRYRWLGELPHGRAMGHLAASHLMVLSSSMEGGANVICEALSAGTPVIASAIPGNIGMLGGDYPGYYPLGDTAALAESLLRAAQDEGFYGHLAACCLARRPLFLPEREKEGLRSLLAEL